jgi:hypothetical protein
MSWVYAETERNPPLFTVGFYAPDGRWLPESDHATREAAAARAHWLNGGEETLILSSDQIIRPNLLEIPS